MSKQEETVPLKDFLNILEEPRSIWWHISCIPYRLRMTIEDVLYNLKYKRIKELLWMIKFWYRYTPFTSHCGLYFLKWHTENMLESSKNYQIVVGQEECEKEMETFIKILENELEGGFGNISVIGVEKFLENQNKNSNLLGEFIQKHNHWGT